MNQKGVAHILLLIVLLAGLIAGVYLVTSGNPLKLFSKAFEKKSSLISTKMPYKGYIIQFKDLPAVSTYTSKGKDAMGSMAAQSYEQTLQLTHQAAKKEIFSRLTTRTQGSSQIKILGEYTKSFNGLALDITDQQAQSLISSPYVKQVYPNLQVKANLAESVPLIGADKVWQQKDIQGRNITGEGVKVGVIDTGVDYTHPDLGSTLITERNFQKIASLSERWFASMAFADNKLAYTDWRKIYIYSFDSGQQTEINPFSAELWPGKVAFDGRYIVYYAYYINHNAPVPETTIKSGLYIYDLQTGDHKKMTNAQGVGSIYIKNGKVIYGRNANQAFDGKYFGPYVYIYDIATGTEEVIQLTEFLNSFESIVFKMSGNLMAAFVPGDSTAKIPPKHIIYNLETQQKQDLTTPDPGEILDFQGNKILYLEDKGCSFACKWDTYYLYDINTKESTKLHYDDSSSTTSSLVNSQSKFGNLKLNTKDNNQKVSSQYSLMTYFTVPFGSIGNQVIYFNRTVSRGKIIAYDMNKKKYSLINLLKVPIKIEAYGDKICFSSDIGRSIYCHDYDPQDPYDLPRTIINNKITGGYNFIDQNTDPIDDQGHGTHVSAIVASIGNPKGVATGAKIVAYKALDSGGQGYFSDIIAALEKAVDTKLDSDTGNDIDVVNMSLGGDCYGRYNINCGPDDALSQTVDSAVDAGITVVVSAGNEGPNASTIGSPGTARKAITVGAVNKQKVIADFSSRGPVTWNSENVSKPDIVAPGVAICAAEYDSWLWGKRCFDDKHISIGGTSMAAPHVAGLVALIKQANPSLTPQQIKDTLKSTAVNLSGYDQNTQGSGLVDAEAAIKSILEPRPPSSGGRACVQVITPARKESTGECRDFPTPCDVPSGWVKVDSCGVSDDISSPSPSPFSKLTPGGRVTPSVSCTACLADVNKDKNVNISDISLWSYCRVRGINSSPRCSNADITKECLISQFGKKCSN